MKKSVRIKRDDKTCSYSAICPDCRKCVFMVRDEAIQCGTRRPTGSSLLLPQLVGMSAQHDCEAHA